MVKFVLALAALVALRLVLAWVLTRGGRAQPRAAQVAGRKSPGGARATTGAAGGYPQMTREWGGSECRSTPDPPHSRFSSG